jgi:hypothetical protein
MFNLNIHTPCGDNRPDATCLARVNSNSITIIGFLQLNFAEEQIKQMKPTGIDVRPTESAHNRRPSIYLMLRPRSKIRG